MWRGGFIASLCREVQGGTPLRISVADKVTTYRMVEEKFEATDTAQRLAMLSVGAFWGEVRRRWKGATYEEQQEWIQFAPLPPPMTATSLGYFEAVLETNAALMAESLHERLGPFEMTGQL